MKKKILYSVAGIVVVLIAAGFVALGTTQTGLTEVRAEAGEDGSSLTGAFNYRTKGNFGEKSVTAWELPDTDNESAANTVKFYFSADGNGKTFSASIFAYTAINGPAQLVCTIAATGGAQRVILWPDGSVAEPDRFWVDTISITDLWPKTVSAGTSGSGNDLVTTLFFDTMGCKFFKPYVWNADGSTGTEAGNVSIWGSYF